MLPLRRRLQASGDQPPEVERTKNQPRQEGREKRVDGEKKGRENLFISSGGFFRRGRRVYMYLAGGARGMRTLNTCC